MINIIDKDFGHIIELERNAKQSIAVVCINPRMEKPSEVHLRTTERFQNIQGSGQILTIRGTRNIVSEYQNSTVEPGISFRLKNTGPDYWLMYIVCRPPYDPTDEY